MIKNILDNLLMGNVEAINYNNAVIVNNRAISIMNNESMYGSLTEQDKIDLRYILEISNILYNNTDRSVLFLDDGLYDLLIVLYNRYSNGYPVGAPPVKFESNTSDLEISIPNAPVHAVNIVPQEKIDNSLFITNGSLLNMPKITSQDIVQYPIEKIDDKISKRLKVVSHKYPKLVGTLDKCKFVLDKQAFDLGQYNDPNVQIFERDFIQKHMTMGLYNQYTQLSLIAELKYDGISIEAEVSDEIISARTRGDTANDMASDLTPLFSGYKFKRAIGQVDHNEVFGMKFEAVITYDNLYRLSQLTGKDYKNPRNAIIGITSASDARKYRDFITLVPLATSLDIDRVTEVEFMNKYYSSGEFLRTGIISGDYKQVLYQVKQFVEEAEYLRAFLPIMYDGVVVSYLNDYLINGLGRQNSVNKYSIAIKFNSLKKQTIFTGYSYTVGQNGVITPMINYNPVEFYGGIHVRSSGHSFNRFKELQLRIGDIIDVEYVNDVMPYVTKPDNQHNRTNPNPLVPFIKYCPECGTLLITSESGKSIICPNGRCKARGLTRMTNMLHKLGLKGFSEESLRKINKYSLNDLFRLEQKDVLPLLGELNSIKFIEQINELKTNTICDYSIIGSLGFTNIAIATWKLILNKITVEDLINMMDIVLYSALVQIDGIGPTTATTIINERDMYYADLITISQMPNVLRTIGTRFLGKKIRFSGIRDKMLCDTLKKMGHDASDGGLTNDTDILIIPNRGYTSTKTAKALKNNIAIYSYDEFVNNMANILQ